MIIKFIGFGERKDGKIIRNHMMPSYDFWFTLHSRGYERMIESKNFKVSLWDRIFNFDKVAFRIVHRHQYVLIDEFDKMVYDHG